MRDDDDDDYDDDDDDERPFFNYRNDELLQAAKAAKKSQSWSVIEAILDELEYRDSLRASEVQEEVEDMLPPEVTQAPPTRIPVGYNAPTSNGQILGGHYKLGPLLGMGGFAEVFEASDLRNPHGPRLVIKRPLGLAKAESLRHEFLIGHRLNHPNICTYHACLDDTATGNAFLVLEHGGRSIADRLRSGQNFGAGEFLRIAEHMGAALHYAHSQTPSVLHLDVSPANVLLDDNGVARLTDFGISTRAMTRTGLTRHTAAARTVGATPVGQHDIYSAPEVFRPPPAQVGRRADQWSLAMVLYSIAARKVFSAREEFSGSSLLSPSQNRALERALSDEPSQRFPTVMDFINALR